MKNLLLLVVVICCCQLVSAQSLSKADVISVKFRNTGTITQNGLVKGYYNFYNLDKKDKKNNNYLLSITDENLHEISSINIVRPSTYLLIEGVYNGDSFGFLFYDTREKSVELIAYDKTLKEAGKTVKKLENKYAYLPYAYIADNHEPSQAFLLAVPNKGFLYYGIKDDSKSDYEIEFYSNSMKKQWSSYGPADDYDFENAAEAFQDEQYVGSLVMKRKSLFSLDPDMELVIHGVGDGKVLFKIPMLTSKYALALAEVFFDKDKQQFLVFGEYFNKEDNVLKGASLGFITVVLDMKGKVISEKTNSWKGDISKLVAAKDKDKFEETGILFHEFVRTNDGQIFAIGEQYKKGGTPMAQKLNIYNMIIFQFDPTFTIKKVNVFEKDKNPVSMPQGMLIFSSKMLSYIAKSIGGFDYIFTQVAEDKSTFVVAYVNYDREKGEKAKNMLGSIVYTPEKTFVVDKLALNRKSSDYFVYRAKPGYIMVSEYFQKERRLDSRLEKINY